MTYALLFTVALWRKAVRSARADVADFMLRQLHDDQYLGSAVELSY